jgi:hypothetical protein
MDEAPLKKARTAFFNILLESQAGAPAPHAGARMTQLGPRRLDRWTPGEEKLLRTLTTPRRIQDFLDGLEYSSDAFYRSPRDVLRDRQAHCVDGALFAAAALRRLGYPPRIMELAAVRDDDHLLAVYRRGDRLGAAAKSNFTTLRFREPVYLSLRELAMSYFDGYFNVDGERSMRRYSVTIDLARFDALNWERDARAVEPIIARLEAAQHYPVASRARLAGLTKVDERWFRAGMLGAKEEGLYRP